MNEGFCELTLEEMMEIEGGGFFAKAWNNVCKTITISATGVTVGAKVGAATSGPVGFVAGAIAGGIVETVWDYAIK